MAQSNEYARAHRFAVFVLLILYWSLVLRIAEIERGSLAVYRKLYEFPFPATFSALW